MFQWSCFKVLNVYNVCNARGVAPCKHAESATYGFVFYEPQFVPVKVSLFEKKVTVLSTGKRAHSV
jgi:hypothetical protein